MQQLTQRTIIYVVYSYIQDQQIDEQIINENSIETDTYIHMYKTAYK